MNKTITINLNGIVYHIAEDAYIILQNYLISIKDYFANDEDKDEIIADIEARLGELFSEKLSNSREVIMLEDVDAAIKTMGTTADFEEEDESENAGNQKERSKKLFRDSERKILGGVFSGISAYFGINDALWLRLVASLSVIAAIFGYWGFPLWLVIVYVLLWIIVPKTKSNIDQIRMQGKPVNLNKIKESFKNQSPLEKEDLFDKTFSFLGEMLNVVLNLFVKAVEILFKSWLWLLVIVLPLVLLGVIISIASSLPALNNLIIGSRSTSAIIAICLILLFAIPIFFVIYGIARTMFKTKIGSGITLGLLSGIWILCLLCLGVTAGLAFKNFTNKQSIVYESQALQPLGDTIYLKASEPSLAVENSHFSYNTGKIKFNNSEVSIKRNVLQLKNVALKIFESADSNIIMSSKIYAKGKSKKIAEQNASMLTHGYRLSNDTLYIDNFITQKSSTPYRGQLVEANLYLPPNAVLFVDESMSGYITKMDNRNYQNSKKLSDSFWAWQSDGLKCIKNCDESGKKIAHGGDWVPHDLPIFEEIEAEGRLNITIVQSDTQFVLVKGAEDYDSYLDIEVSDKTLEIEQEDGYNKDLEIQIGIKNLSEASFAGAGNVTIENTDLIDLELELAGAINIEANINCENLTLEMAGAPKLVLNGKGAALDAELIGASKLYAKNYNCNNVEISLAGACKANIYATENLNAKAIGSSKIVYYGSPSNVIQTTIGSSSVQNNSEKDDEEENEKTTLNIKPSQKIVELSKLKLPKSISQIGLPLLW